MQQRWPVLLLDSVQNKGRASMQRVKKKEAARRAGRDGARQLHGSVVPFLEKIADFVEQFEKMPQIPALFN
jgi:hypothetical protein